MEYPTGLNLASPIGARKYALAEQWRVICRPNCLEKLHEQYIDSGREINMMLINSPLTQSICVGLLSVQIQ